MKYIDYEKSYKISTKDKVRGFAITWQSWASKQDLSYEELAQWSIGFTKLGRKFGLLKEFKANGII